jgi:hypothetical protein
MGKSTKTKSPAQVFDARGWTTAHDVARTCCDCPCSTGVFGGTWSLVDLYREVTARLGQCDVDIMTWVASGSTFEELHGWLRSQRVRELRLVIDSMAVQRGRLDLLKIENQFGRQSIRVIRTHAKGAVFSPVDGSTPLVLQTSANLNKNARLESFFSLRQSEPAAYWKSIFDEVFLRADEGVSAYDGKACHNASRAVRGVDTGGAPKDGFDKILELL